MARRSSFLAAALEGRRIRKAPVRADRLARPDRTDFTRRGIADRDDKVHGGGAFAGKFVPALGTEALRRQAGVPERFECQRMHRTLGVTACAVGVELTTRHAVQVRFSEDGARGIAGAQEQDVVHSGRTVLSFYPQAADFGTTLAAVIRQESQQCAHSLVIRRVDDAAALTL